MDTGPGRETREFKGPGVEMSSASLPRKGRAEWWQGRSTRNEAVGHLQTVREAKLEYGVWI